MSALTRERLATLGPAHGIPAGPFRPAEAFGRSAPVVLEIGCGHGHAAIAYAKSFPEHDLLALDVHGPGIARMLADAEREGVPNLRIVEDDVEDFIADRVAPQTFSAVHLYFPDPWPKARHARRRFVSAERLEMLARVLRPGGVVRIATDQAFYADHVRAVVADSPYFDVVEVARPEWRPEDGFEAKGRAAGRDIHELELVLR